MSLASPAAPFNGNPAYGELGGQSAETLALLRRVSTCKCRPMTGVMPRPSRVLRPLPFSIVQVCWAALFEILAHYGMEDNPTDREVADQGTKVR